MGGLNENTVWTPTQRQRVDLRINLTHWVSHPVKRRPALMSGSRQHVAPWRPNWAAAGRTVNYSVVIQNVSALIRGEDLTCTCTCRGGSQVRGQRSWSWQGAPPQMCWLILMINNLLLSYSQKKNSEKCKRSDRKPNNLKFKHEMKPLFKTQTEVTRAPLKTSFI